MPVIDVSLAQPGMVLAADVLDKRGRVLIPAGKELVEKYVTALPAWGVTRIEVEGDDIAGAAAEAEPWAVDEATAELEALFQKSNRGHPAVDNLFDACVSRRAAQLQAAAGDQA